ncbi:hypothetical protein [uncultured Marinobacter sp.]|uniref:hypothetical protein n=1 Tax=uncultured Marinobacter sp. TaxID=187379 RepID=UPI0030D797F3|tara:strand:+ start:121 stop:384 length:264 start_codon:yes stop_codon:yes gene_type:complete
MTDKLKIDDKRTLWVELDPDFQTSQTFTVSLRPELIADNEHQIVKIKRGPTLVITTENLEQQNEILAVLRNAEENRTLDFPFGSRSI